MWTKIKLFLATSGAILISVLYAMLSKSNSQRDKAKSDLNNAVETNKHNSEINQIDDKLQQTIDDVNVQSNNDINDELQQYDRNRKNSD